ncbi:MAG: P-II family nitrogen regulator [Endomicrobium sp.]|jgi:nitrogen regulatory protein PII 1|nr:P-II family nitrogen regulator [Endomicrobium sp.]
MKMVKLIVRPEKASDVLANLSKAGFSAATRVSILGRGKQRGIKVGDIYYDEIPKELIMIVVEDENVAKIQKIIIDTAKTGKKGSFGDGKIFITPVESVITISTASNTL